MSALVELLKTLYQPINASSSEARGAFVHYIFPDGAELSVRRSFENRLFGNEWKHERELAKRKTGTESHLYKVGNVRLVARSLYFFAEKTPGDLYVREVADILGKRIRIESPLFELTTPNGPKLVGTGEVQGNPFRGSVLTASSKKRAELLSKLAAALARLHVSGFAHGHPHWDNWLVKKSGHLVMLDPKFLRRLSNVLSVTGAESRVEQVKSTLAFPAATERDLITRDLRHVVCWPTQRGELKTRDAGFFLTEYANAYRKEYARRKV